MQTYPIQKIKENALKLLKGVSPIYTYHSIDHTLYVLEVSLKIGKYYKLSILELELIQIAALFHDIGYLDGPQDHEQKSCSYVEKEMEKYKIKKEHLTLIQQMIMSTKIPQQPKSLLDRIIADADLEYIGTNSFWETGEKLFQEIKFSNPTFTTEEWNRIQFKFLSDHIFHTSYCKRYKQKRKKKYINELKTMIL